MLKGRNFTGTTTAMFFLGQTPGWLGSLGSPVAFFMGWWLIFLCPGDFFYKAISRFFFYCFQLRSTRARAHTHTHAHKVVNWFKESHRGRACAYSQSLSSEHVKEYMWKSFSFTYSFFLHSLPRARARALSLTHSLTHSLLQEFQIYVSFTFIFLYCALPISV